MIPEEVVNDADFQRAIQQVRHARLPENDALYPRLWRFRRRRCSGSAGRSATRRRRPAPTAAVQLEEQQSNRTGWLFASGAFDKGDQAFIRDQQEQTQHAEEAQLDRERSEFSAVVSARARAEEAAQELAAASRAAAAKRQLEGERCEGVHAIFCLFLKGGARPCLDGS